MKRIICLGMLFSMLLLCGCSTGSKMKNGFYTAEMSDFSHGWKEYLCIMVKDDTIVYAEFNAKDSSGYIKSWDNAYMRNMNAVQGTYPNEYTRTYVTRLVAAQDDSTVDLFSGATSSGKNFQKLATAVIDQSRKGDSSVIIVQSESAE